MDKAQKSSVIDVLPLVLGAVQSVRHRAGTKTAQEKEEAMGQAHFSATLATFPPPSHWFD